MYKTLFASFKGHCNQILYTIILFNSLKKTIGALHKRIEKKNSCLLSMLPLVLRGCVSPKIDKSMSLILKYS